MLGLQFSKTKSFPWGVHPPECKQASRASAIRRLPFAPRLIVPLSQHIGLPAVPTVREGQEVVRGEPIARPGGFVSVPMHAPATGKVEAIELAPNAKGGMTESIIIRPYPSASQEVLYGGTQDPACMPPAGIVQAVQATGVVGLGGAAFPTHVKLAVPEGKSVDTLIANGCECEPYLTADHRVMLECAAHIYDGIRIAMKATGAARSIIAIEENKADAAKALEAARPPDLEAAVEVLPTKYPQGAEKMLSQVLLEREVPSGGLPADVGLAVFNVATLAQIGELLPLQQGLIERVVTISGSGVDRPGNYLMALGTPLGFALDAAGMRPDAAAVILGGPMMGATAASLDLPITKGITGVVVYSAGECNGSAPKVYPCIKCAACVEVCPIRLNPSRLGMLAAKERHQLMEEQYHLNDCFECGCCSYVCPSKIPLVQHFRVAKAMNRERQHREQAAALEAAETEAKNGESS